MTARKRSRVRAPGGQTTVVVGGGANGVTFDIGSETETDAFRLTMTRDLGSETESLSFVPTFTLSQGAETTNMVIVPSLTATFPTGSETEADLFSMSMTRDLGSEAESMTVSATAQLTDYTNTATATQNSGTTNWTNPTNAQGAFNDTEAQISYAPVTETQTDATLKCSGLVVTTTPTDFTRTATGIRIRHRWDLTITLPVAGVTDAVHTIELRDSGGTLIAQLNQRLASGGGGTQATLLTEDYDITSLVSEAQLNAGLQVWCNASYDFLVANGNASWQVDGVHLVATYTRGGIT